MSEPLLETGSLPELDNNSGDIPEPSDPAPYGYKKDGTPKKRPGRPPGSAGGYSGGSSRSLSKLEGELPDKLVEYIGLPISFVSPLAAGVIDARSEKTARSLVRLAENSERFRRALETFVTGSSVTDLGITVFAVIVAVRVDMSNQTPDEMGVVARYFDIDEIYMQVYGPVDESPNGETHLRSMGLMGDVENGKG